jgi:hypothetical protein
VAVTAFAVVFEELGVDLSEQVLHQEAVLEVLDEPGVFERKRPVQGGDGLLGSHSDLLSEERVSGTRRS